ncbi:hypothetical protein [Nocardia nova]|uniref:hypothetical protein n=1 Tax=Nocardia nova TaxID=37330 RepID=UPI00273929A0|nr:hypothetical protein [Nocardia nova]
MNDVRRMGYLAHEDGVSIVGQDGFAWEPCDLEPEPAALEVPTIDVEPEAVVDREVRRELEN